MLTIRNFMDARKRRSPSFKTMEGVKYSTSNTTYYYKLLRKMLVWMHEEFERTVIHGLETKSMTEKIVSIRDESPNEKYKKMLALFNKKLRAKYPRKVIEKLVRRALKRSSDYSQREFNRKLKSFGLDLSKGENVLKKYSSYMSTVVEENIMLVKNLQDEQAKRLKSVVLRGLREGIAVNRLAGDIRKSLGIARRRATLIARTETHKLTQQLADYRASEVGFEEGVWTAVMDNRTSSQHAKFNGRRFNLKKGIWDPKTQSWNWPGRRPNCRCRTRYLVPGFDD